MVHRRAIGLITTFISGRFFEQIMSGVQAVAWQHQVDLLVVLGTPEHVVLTGVGQQCVDGWLVLTYTQGLELLAQQGKPLVTISCRVPDQAFPAVFPDNRRGTEAIMEHLISQGHRRIAFVGDISIGDINERFMAYQSVLESRGIPADPELILLTDSPMPERGVRAAHRLMSLKEPCTAVVAGNDWTAIGLMRELQANGVRVPADVAVVGFDDIPEAQVTTPPLSTVRQHSDELGATAARLLMAQVAGRPAEPVVETIPTTFVWRGSSGGGRPVRPAAPAGLEIRSGPLWQASLSKELVRVLLPALPLETDPSPAQVWPEVDKLVQILDATISGTAFQEIDRGMLQAIFSSRPIMNASPEILVEMMRVLEAAGLKQTGQSPEPGPAVERVHAMCDELSIEIMRFYRRRQGSSQRTLSEILQSQYNISQLLIQRPPQQIDWLGETPMYSGCLALWSPSGGDQAPVMSVTGCYRREGTVPLRVGTTYSAAQFPPLDMLPSSAAEKGITTCLVLPVRSADHDWGMLAVSGPLISNDPWLEDNTINTLEICCGFLGLALEREALQESLRHSSENEEFLTERIDTLKSRLST